ncbi:MAG: A/G-specific adenine glycosylase [Bacteroidales bacterium]|nr:A/G-specific adenine glycosylase [Bacteroidales bacterium]
MNFASKLKNWYIINQRNLPWRSTTDPYKIWVSEVILQQTRIDQGHDYYLRFTARFPDVKSLANASEDQVLKMWQGLGYYSRARNMHTTAKTIVDVHGGKFPETYIELIALKGIGTYTAAAIVSICFGYPTPTVDGNVLRVISRLFAIEEPIDKAVGKKMIFEALNEIFDLENPGIFNQALMDFGAMVCKPKSPSCHECIFKMNCAAFSQSLVSKLPIKSKISNQLVRHFHYLVVLFEKNGELFTYLNKRGNKDIWAGLYDFPMIETINEFSPEQLTSTERWQEFFVEGNPELLNVSAVYKHQLSHQLLLSTFFLIRTDEKTAWHDPVIMIRLKEVYQYPMPRLVDRYITENNALRKVLENIYPGLHDKN